MIRGVLSCAISAVIGAWLVAGQAAAECVPAPQAEVSTNALSGEAQEAQGPMREDRSGRVVAPVSVNGNGPYRFVVDTGANRSALAQGLADELGLPALGPGQVHNVYGVSDAPMVRVDHLQYGGVSVRDGALPVLRGEVLAGERGLLGVDGMVGRRVLIDFERDCIEIVATRSARALRGWAELRGEMRLGHLVIIEGNISGVDANIFLDTGSDSTLANTALTEAIAARVGRNLSHEQVVIAYSAGRPVVLDQSIVIPRMSLGPLDVRNITAFVGDFHIFDLWQLSNEPTLLVGMDVLSQASALAIDYGRSRIYIRVQERTNSAASLR